MALLLALRQASPLQAAGRLAPALLASSLQQIRGLAAPSNQMALIKELRERTGSPIGVVKKCLESCGWDLGEKMRMRRAACERSGWTSCSDRRCRLLPLSEPLLPPFISTSLPGAQRACRGGNCGAAEAGAGSCEQEGFTSRG